MLSLGGGEMIFVTGGAGFIGANFVLDWFSETLEPLLVIDKLTYAGNRQNLATVEGRNSLLFEQVDICSGEAIGGFCGSSGHAQLSILLPRATSTARSSIQPSLFARMSQELSPCSRRAGCTGRSWMDTPRTPFASCTFPPMKFTDR